MRFLILTALLAAPASAELPGVHLGPRTVRLRHEPRCILEAVAREIADTIGRHRGPAVDAVLRGAARHSAALPRIRFESVTPLADFIAAARPQDPTIDRFSGLYAVGVNEIFLIDAADYYERFVEGSGRSMDDSLAHEYVHYLQVAYLGYSLATLATDDAEFMAIDYQNLYRERYVKGGTPPCP